MSPSQRPSAHLFLKLSLFGNNAVSQRTPQCESIECQKRVCSRGLGSAVAGLVSGRGGRGGRGKWGGGRHVPAVTSSQSVTDCCWLLVVGWLRVALCCVVLRCVARRCVALRCFALLCVVLCCVVLWLDVCVRLLSGSLATNDERRTSLPSAAASRFALFASHIRTDGRTDGRTGVLRLRLRWFLPCVLLRTWLPFTVAAYSPVVSEELRICERRALAGQ